MRLGRRQQEIMNIIRKGGVILAFRCAGGFTYQAVGAHAKFGLHPGTVRSLIGKGLLQQVPKDDMLVLKGVKDVVKQEEKFICTCKREFAHIQNLVKHYETDHP